MFRKNKWYGSAGMSFLNLPVGRNDAINTKRKNLGDLEMTTAANMIGVTGIRPNSPMILCGKNNKVYPVLRQLLRMATVPYVIVGTQKDLGESCFDGLETDWNENHMVSHLPAGNGMLAVKPGAETNYMMRESLTHWDDHLIVLCLGNGLQIDAELLNLLNSLGQYIIVTAALRRSIKGIEGCKLTVEELLASMDYILVLSIGTSGKSLMEILPSCECVKVTNTTDFSLHRDSPVYDSDDFHHRSGRGLRLYWENCVQYSKKRFRGALL